MWAFMLFEIFSHQALDSNTMQTGGGWGKNVGGIAREFGMDLYTLLYLKWIINKDLLHSLWNSVQCYVVAWMGGGVWGEWIHVYVWLSPFSVHLKLSQHC